MVEDGTDQGAPAEMTAPNHRPVRNAMLAAGLIVVSGAGFGAWQLLRPGIGDPTSPSPSVSVRKVLSLESFTVNLADAEEGRFLRTTFSLGVDGELPQPASGPSKAVEGSAVSVAAIRDSILAVLAQSKSDELLSPEGKAKLKANLLNALNRDVPALGAREIYFTEFLVQR